MFNADSISRPRPAAVPPLPVVRALQTAGRWLGALQRKLAPPQLSLLDLAMGRWRLDALAAIARLRVPDALAAGARTAGDLARELGLHEDSLFRVLRALASDGLLEALPDRRFALTSMTRALVSDAPSSMRNMILMLGQERQARVWANLHHSIRTGERAWNLFHDHDIWAHLAENEEDASIFHGAMAELTREGALAYARGFDFGRSGSVVDIGGGEGQLLSVVLKTHPSVRGVLVDGAGALARAPALLEREGVRDRCELVEADIMKHVPRGHGAYVAKNIVHGIPIGQEVEVLRSWRAAMGEGARLVLIEVVVPEDDGPYLQYLDLQMLVGSGGRERTRAEYAQLLASAGFHLEEVVETPSPLSLLVARPI